MKVVVTGAAGLLGSEVVRRWTADEVVPLTRADLELTDAVAVTGTIGELAPDVVVNCAAWTEVDACEADPQRAHLQNGVVPGLVAAACAAVGARLVHISTDYVHGGDPPLDAGGRPRGWREDDPVLPASVYGRSKAEGEAAVRAVLPEHHIVRTAWVCGAGGRSFVSTMLELAERGVPLKVVDDQHGNPTFTEDLAIALREVALSDSFGTWNRTNTGWCTWYDLAAATFEEAGLEVDLGRQPSAALDRPAPRPSWSVLEPARATAAGLAPLPPWRDGLRRLVAELRA